MIGVAGGIAAYKAVSVVRALVLLGHDVHVIPTEAALRFVGRPTFEAISRNPVRTDVFDDVEAVRHVALGQSADIIAVVPATANTIARMTTGLADDLLGTTLLASRAPILIAPAMHTEMWEHPATQHNIATLVARGVKVVGPATGQLTGPDSGVGRLADPHDIVAAICAVLEGEVARPPASGEPHRDLDGRRVLVSAGGTREPLDPVRFLGNRSSGRQGVALAERARARGAEVTLVAANLEVPVPPGITVVFVETAEQLATACREQASTHDVIIMTAAVADYRPASVATGKITKEDAGDHLTVELVKNPDVLRELALGARPDQTVVGFAAETEPDDDALLARARRKLARKGCDFLVVNRVGVGVGFQREDNEVTLLRRGGDIAGHAAGPKIQVADRILDLVARPQ